MDGRPYGALAADSVVATPHDLVLFLGGDSGSIIDHLVALIGKATPAVRGQLARGFDYEVRAWRTWQLHAHPPTAGELATSIAIVQRAEEHVPELLDVFEAAFARQAGENPRGTS